jgi:hypothetical protein
MPKSFVSKFSWVSIKAPKASSLEVSLKSHFLTPALRNTIYMSFYICHSHIYFRFLALMSGSFHHLSNHFKSSSHSWKLVLHIFAQYILWTWNSQLIVHTHCVCTKVVLPFFQIKTLLTFSVTISAMLPYGISFRQAECLGIHEVSQFCIWLTRTKFFHLDHIGNVYIFINKRQITSFCRISWPDQFPYLVLFPTV